MGLMGHFVGDSSMPLHNTSDYDGWKANHGGLHSYYEGAIVEALPDTLTAEVSAQALKLVKARKPAGAATIADWIKSLSVISNKEVASVYAADKMETPSAVEIGPDGKEKRTYGKRVDADKAYPAFKKLIISELARSAASLAQMWDQMYVEAGRPDLTKYKSYRYPLQPDFVAMDYMPGGNGIGKAPTPSQNRLPASQYLDHHD
jgi:hypothetical protein